MAADSDIVGWFMAIRGALNGAVERDQEPSKEQLAVVFSSAINILETVVIDLHALADYHRIRVGDK